MAVVQEMCARIGMVTGQGLAANIRERFPRWILFAATILLFFANAFNIGADLGAMAKGVQLLNPQFNFIALVIGFAVLSLLLQIFTTYKTYAKFLKYLTFVLFAYIATAFVVHMDWAAIAFNTLVPHIAFSKDQILLVCAILGTTISPYLFFWQSSQEVEEEILQGDMTIESRRGATATDIRHMRADVWVGMFFSNIVMFFIIAVCAATLHLHGITNIQTADQAAAALTPLVGPAATLLFALGIIGTGLLAVPVLAGSAAYAAAESFKWKEGLYRKPTEAIAFYAIIAVSMILGMLLNFVGIDPIKALIYSAVGNGLVAPIILVLIVLLSSNKKVMGKHANHPAVTWIGWITVALMTVAGAAVLVTL
jgi:NRAMP (natural resistance-associated macrophage protein)-like metal ion transporter